MNILNTINTINTINEEKNINITELLKQKGFIQVETPLFMDYAKVLPFMSEDTQNSQVKLQGPRGETLVLRGDSTISLIVGDVLKSKPTQSPRCIFYDEPNYTYDFEKLMIRENRQVGIEILSDNAKAAFRESFSLAVEIARLTCGDDMLIEISQAAGLKAVVSTLLQGNLKKMDEWMYFLSRKNTREIEKILRATQTLDADCERISKLLTSPRDIGAFIAETNGIQAFEPMRLWLKSVQETLQETMQNNISTKLDIDFEPLLTVEKPYYTNETFTIYDTKRHTAFITGGTYRFDVYGICGCGFSIQTGGAR